MKNKKVLLTALTVALAIICAPVYSTPFDGTWFLKKTMGNGSITRITFSDNTFTYEWNGGDIYYIGKVNGSFTYDDKKIELQAQDGSKWSTTYKFNNGLLTLSKGTGCWHHFGDFYKSAVEEYQSIVPDSTPTALEGAWINPYGSNSPIYTFTGNTFTFIWFSGYKENGRFIFDNKNVTLINEHGRKWTTPYSVNKDKTQLDLKNKEEALWWYGRFNRLSLAEYQSIAPNSAPTAFEGTWKYPNQIGSENATINFTGNSFSYTANRGKVNGRFTNTDKAITFFADDGRKWITTYTFNDGYFLQLEEGTGTFWWYGTFCSTSLAEYQKITPSSAPTAFQGTWKMIYSEAKNATITFSGNSFSYTWDSGSKKGRFTNTDKGITFFIDDGFKWVTTYEFDDRCLMLGSGTGAFWWYGGFASKASLDEYQSIAPSSAPTVFEGKWKHSNTKSENATFIFSGNSFTYTSGSISRKGRIIFDDKNITLITEDGLNKWTAPYTVSNTKLSLEKGSGGWYGAWYGTFNKQK